MIQTEKPYKMRSVDLRALLGLTAPTLTDIYKKLGINFADKKTAPRQGAVKHIYGPDVRRVLESRGYEFCDRAQVISFIMCKGGVGKTTSTFFLAQRLSAYGSRVLVIDADSQGNLTSAFNLDSLGIEIDEETPVLMDIVMGDCTVEEAMVQVTPNLHIIPSTPVNANLEGRIRERFKNPSLPIKNTIAPLLDSYDYILIDCAPALNLTNTAVVCASDLTVMPVAPDKFSQLGLEQTLSEIGLIEQDFGLEIDKRIIFTKYDAREFTSLKYLTEIADKYNDLRFSTAIRTSSDVKNVVTRHEDLFSISKSKAKTDYDAFTQEIMGLNGFFKKGRGTRTSATA